MDMAFHPSATRDSSLASYSMGSKTGTESKLESGSSTSKDKSLELGRKASTTRDSRSLVDRWGMWLRGCSQRVTELATTSMDSKKGRLRRMELQSVLERR
mmetsp:Transcript_16544/g.24473  ORF Transcript_16544/g.24473 Transcript_16544/m.24473 type:complete len:100 (+) Transcript_16544:215-514(+)